MQLVGMGDDIDIGNPQTDQEIMNIICNVLANFDTSAITKDSQNAKTPRPGGAKNDQDTHFQAQLVHFEVTQKKAATPR